MIMDILNAIWEFIKNVLDPIATVIGVGTFVGLIIKKLNLISEAKASLIGSHWIEYYDGREDVPVYDSLEIDHNEYNDPMCIRSSIALKDLKIYQINDDDGDPLAEPNLVGEYGFLPANMALTLHILVPEGAPRYKLTATRIDFVKIEHEISFNGSGCLRWDMLNAQFTAKSTWYYFFK